MTHPARQVKPVHFEDFGASEFERLVFAFLLRRYPWRNLEWYGQAGADLGRDVWGVLDSDVGSRSVCVQCANRKRVTSGKVLGDLDKIIAAPEGKPDEFWLVAACNLSGRLRDGVREYAEQKGVYEVKLWSGTEFEEQLRAHAESLLQRFLDGVEFPDAPDAIRQFVSQIAPSGDHEVLGLMAQLFDRPAFYTPFHMESSIPAFKKAVTDTIEALNTGVHRLRDGTEIRRIPSRHQLRDGHSREVMAQVVSMLNDLRSAFDTLVRTGEIRFCRCDDPECSVFFPSAPGARQMNALRTAILERFDEVYPELNVSWFRRRLGPPWQS